ncbi:MAG: deoxyribose-phosphate aldolase [Prevotellaceae bacterium]|jgi:deoxyribose-phosphate aldolase|nr:deoxyribose-phosphate aldolase [Prevotellaceae bacterium]
MNIQQDYKLEVNLAEINERLATIKVDLATLHIPEVFKKCFSSIDLTTLNVTDTLRKGEKMAKSVSDFSKNFKDLPNVAAICVYPSLVNVVRRTLKDDKVKIASVAAGFPSSQTFIDIKISECIMAIENGADEIDIVISLGSFLSGDYDTVSAEIARIKDAIENTHLKVILETGALPDLSAIRLASLLAMEAGADFIKTSTGKIEPAATPETALIMVDAIGDYYKHTGRKVGFKPAGGISTTSDAVLYYAIVSCVLGEEWITPELFRIGASRLANNLLTDITGLTAQYF